MVASRWRWSAGVPKSDRFRVHPAKEEVQVVVEGDADAAVHLHAVVDAARRRSRPMKALATLASSAASGAPACDRDRRPRR